MFGSAVVVPTKRVLVLLAAVSLLVACSGGSAPATPGATPDLSEASIADLQARMASGELSSHQITDWYLARIAALDKAGPRLNAVIEINPDALALADALDAERKSGKLRGALHGIPILVKDNFDTADRMHTTAGSLALLDASVDQDATVIARLREAGAVILGKTNLSEWANFRSSHSSSGWSGRGGQTRNPYVLDRNPCGSSSGTGAGVSASLAAAGLGTETDGSIVCPASANGLVGIKPTVGLVSRAGIVPISHSQDTAGPMARSVQDAATLLGVIAGTDPHDAATSTAATHTPQDYNAALDADGLRGARIGVLRKPFGFNAEVDAAMERAIATMKAQGAEIVDPVELSNYGKYDDVEMTVLLYEFKSDLEAYLRTRSGGKAQTLVDLIAFNLRESDRELKWFGQELFLQAAAKGPLTEKEYVEAAAKARRMAGVEGIDAALAKDHLDALVAPTGGPAWVTDPVNGDHFSGGSSSPAAVSGYPSITVPAGLVHELPVGISFIGAAWSEPKLIRIAYAYEQASKARRVPKFLPTIAPE